MSNCLITGCAFILDDRAVWGDLHEEGSCFIFNACLTPVVAPMDNDDSKADNIPGEARWQRSLPPDLIKSVRFVGKYAAPFERRGIIIAAKVECELNKAAKDYVK